MFFLGTFVTIPSEIPQRNPLVTPPRKQECPRRFYKHSFQKCYNLFLQVLLREYIHISSKYLFLWNFLKEFLLRLSLQFFPKNLSKVATTFFMNFFKGFYRNSVFFKAAFSNSKKGSFRIRWRTVLEIPQRIPSEIPQTSTSRNLQEFV